MSAFSQSALFLPMTPSVQPSTNRGRGCHLLLRLIIPSRVYQTFQVILSHMWFVSSWVTADWSTPLAIPRKIGLFLLWISGKLSKRRKENISNNKHFQRLPLPSLFLFPPFIQPGTDIWSILCNRLAAHWSFYLPARQLSPILLRSALVWFSSQHLLKGVGGEKKCFEIPPLVMHTGYLTK